MATAEAVFPKIGGDPPFASEYNRFEAIRWNELIYTTGDFHAVLAHTTTAWSILLGTASKLTGDSGVTWADASVDNVAMSGVSKAQGAKGISADHNSNAVWITGDSGDNWAVASTPIDANATRVLDLAFPTSIIAVAGLDVGTAASGIVFSTDAGDVWQDSDFPVGDCPCIDMIDGSDGIAIHVNQSIYTTDDGGATWVDSGQNVNAIPGSQSTIVALTATTGVLLNNDNIETIETFTTGAGGTVRLAIQKADSITNYFSNLVKTTDGNLYFVQYKFTDQGDEPTILSLFRSTDSGVTWSQRALGGNLNTNSTAGFSNFDTKSQLLEHDTNKLLFQAGDRVLMIINESGQ